MNAQEPRTIGRYVLYGPIARGGMATVHFARLVGPDGFSRIVAAKRLHEHFAEDHEIIELFRNEARIASRIHHPNVVPVLDLVIEPGEVVLVQEYVHGVALDKLFRHAARANARIPHDVVVAIIAGVLAGLHASHEAKDECGTPLGVIHRDATPHNVVVGEDGVPRILDFGIAKARSNGDVTRQGLLKGKLTYMAPEQLKGEKATPKVDVYSTGVMLWELLTLRRLHAGRDDLEVVTTTVTAAIPRLVDVVGVSSAEERSTLERLDAIVQRLTAKDPAARPATANEAMEALCSVLAPASPKAVAEWVATTGAEHLAHCRDLLSSNEESWQRRAPVPEEATTTDPKSTSPIMIDRASADDTIPDAPSARPRATLAVAFALAIAVAFGSFGLARSVLPSTAAAPVHAPASVTTASTPAVPVSTVAPAPPPPASSASAVVVPPPPPKPIVRRTFTPAPRPRADTPPVATAPPATATSDCDPPFTYEGTKKVFKPSCL